MSKSFSLKNVKTSKCKIRAHYTGITRTCLNTYSKAVQFPDNIEKRRINCAFNIENVLCRQLFFYVISLSLNGVNNSQKKPLSSQRFRHVHVTIWLL